MLKQLEKDGFVTIADRITYEYSDFEMLSFYAEEVKNIHDEPILKVDNMKIYNPMYVPTLDDYDEIYVQINYTRYFKSVDEFYTLLKLLGYEIKSRSVTSVDSEKVLLKTEG